MRVTPKTEKEIAEADLLPDGWYPFTIGKSEAKTSKKGNEMIVLGVQVYKASGFQFVTDYLIDNELSARRLRHLAETCNILDKYEAGGFEAEDLQGREGYCRIGTQKSKDPQFPDKNVIWDYAREMKETDTPKERTTKSESTMEDDDNIPF